MKYLIMNLIERRNIENNIVCFRSEIVLCCVSKNHEKSEHGVFFHLPIIPQRYFSSRQPHEKCEHNSKRATKRPRLHSLYLLQFVKNRNKKSTPGLCFKAKFRNCRLFHRTDHFLFNFFLPATGLYRPTGTYHPRYIIEKIN